MSNRTEKKRTEHLVNKITLKEKNGMDYTKELCEALEFILSRGNDTGCDLEEYTKEFMRMHSTILPEDKDKRLEILIKNVERVLPELRADNPNLNDSVVDIYITLDAISNEICTPTEDDSYSIDLLPEDDLIEDIGKYYFEKDEAPGALYYEAVTEYVSLLIGRLKNAVKEGDLRIMRAVGIRISLQAVQFEQLYRHRLLKE